MRVFELKDFTPKKHYYIVDDENIRLLVERLNPQLKRPTSNRRDDCIQWAKDILNSEMHDFYWSNMYLNIDKLDWNILMNMSVIDIRPENDELSIFVSYGSLEEYAKNALF